jgi:sigma-B regulation protein RsbU (phosphoserine phosphatase)
MRKEEKVLVVEESPLMAEAIEAAGELPFTCERATDGWDAIEKLETEHYAAIVIDSELPRHSGFGVLTYLREEVGEELDHVIVVTSSDEGTLRRKLNQERLHVVRRDRAVDALNRVMRP